MLDGAAPDALRAAAALGCVDAEPVGGHLRPGLAVELHPRVEPLHRFRIDAPRQILQRRQPARRAPGEVAAIQVHRLVLGEVVRSEEHTSELQSLMRISYAVFCLKYNK